MSLISDALNKAQRERSPPVGSTLYRTPGARPAPRPPRRGQAAAVIGTGVLVGALLFVLGLLYFRSAPTPAAPATPVATAPAPAPIVVSAPPPPPVEALPPPPAPAALSAPEYDLTGVSAVGSTNLLSVTRRRDRHSFWIAVGKTVGDVTAVSYDPADDRAVIRVNGSLQSLKLRDLGPTSDHAAE